MLRPCAGFPSCVPTPPARAGPSAAQRHGLHTPALPLARRRRCTGQGDGPFLTDVLQLRTDKDATAAAAEAAAVEAQRLAAERQAAHDAAMTRATKADAAAAAAAKALDAARALAVQERAAAATDLAPPTSAGPGPLATQMDLHFAMLLQQATAFLNLHAQAVAINNIRSLVPIVLDVDSGNFGRWRDQFLLTLGKFSLQDHVHLDAPVLSPDWAQMDCVPLGCGT